MDVTTDGVSVSPPLDRASPEKLELNDEDCVPSKRRRITHEDDAEVNSQQQEHDDQQSRRLDLGANPDPQLESAFLKLPAEILDLIVQETVKVVGTYLTDEVKVKFRFMQICKMLYNLYRDQIALDAFRSKKGVHNLWVLLDTSKKDEFGYFPFVIIGAVRPSEGLIDGATGPDTHVLCRSFDPEEMREEQEVDEWLWVRSTCGGSSPYLLQEYSSGENAQVDKDVESGNFQVKSWRYDILPGEPFNMESGADGIFESRFDCPECGTAREIDLKALKEESEDPSFLKRWPEYAIYCEDSDPEEELKFLCPRCETSETEKVVDPTLRYTTYNIWEFWGLLY